jgi:hypothetical protein
VSTLQDFEDLAADLEALWHHPQADVRLKKRIVRTLIHEVIVDVDAEAGELRLVIHWKGGVHTELRLPRRRRGHSRLHTSTDIVEAVQVLVRICSDDIIAGVLNRNGLLTGRGNRWTRERVTSLRSKRRIAAHSPAVQQAQGWMNLTQAASFLGISSRTLRLSVERGEIDGEHPLSDGPWVFNRQALETDKVTQVVKRVQRRRKGAAVSSNSKLFLYFPKCRLILPVRSGKLWTRNRRHHTTNTPLGTRNDAIYSRFRSRNSQSFKKNIQA